MALTIPATWNGYRYTGDSATYKMDDATAGVPHTCTLRRAEAAAGQPVLGVQQFQLRYSAAVELAGPPATVISSKDSIELTVRRVVSSSGTKLKADLAELGTLLSDAAWRDNFVDGLLIPQI